MPMTIEQIVEETNQWPEAYRWIRPPVRRHFSTTFPYGILYEDKPDVVRILAAMPLHRDPDYWVHRIE